MGAAQSRGGAATSGENISGAELAHAIREAAVRDGNAARACDASRPATEAELNETSTFNVEYGTGQRKTMTVTSYAPTVFARLRGYENVPTDRFVAEWTLPEERCRTALGEGRSMAMFMKSLSYNFMCKTIAEGEVGVLQAILGDYVEHVRRNPHSLLMRFLMLLRIEANDDVGFLLIFADSFATADKINERWDIKGRVPKPGKFRHFPPPGAEAAAEAGNLTGGAGGAAESPERLATRFSDAGDHPAHSPHSQSIPTRKDKELTRLFWLETPERDQLLGDLRADFDFLCAHGLMDYSILVGVRYASDRPALQAMRQDSHLLSPLASAPSPLGAEAGPVSTEMRQQGAAAGPQGPTCRYHNGVESILGEETYFIAIIDMLTLYNGKKASANFFKGFLWEAPTLSTIPPEPYRQRIASYSTLIFASPDDDVAAIAERHRAAQ